MRSFLAPPLTMSSPFVGVPVDLGAHIVKGLSDRGSFRTDPLALPENILSPQPHLPGCHKAESPLPSCPPPSLKQTKLAAIPLLIFYWVLFCTITITNISALTDFFAWQLKLYYTETYAATYMYIYLHSTLLYCIIFYCLFFILVMSFFVHFNVNF